MMSLCRRSSYHNKSINDRMLLLEGEEDVDDERYCSCSSIEVGEDLFEAMALSEKLGIHQRSPSMMIVVPLLDGCDEPLMCDEMHASFYEFFQGELQEEMQQQLPLGEDKKQEEDGQEKNKNLLVSTSTMESPKSVIPGNTCLKDTAPSTMCVPSSSKEIPPPVPLTDLASFQRNSTFASTSSMTNTRSYRRRCSLVHNRRLRNHALTANEFEESILTKLEPEDF